MIRARNIVLSLGLLAVAACGKKEAATPTPAEPVQPALSEEMLAGKVVYDKWCSHCHDPGAHHPGTNALTVKYQGVKSGVLLEWTDLAPETVEYFVRNGISVMAPFRKTEISDAELKALANYVANASKE
ncbi:MAG: cytochrome c [Parvularculaceae bacterium]